MICFKFPSEINLCNVGACNSWASQWRPPYCTQSAYFRKLGKLRCHRHRIPQILSLFDFFALHYGKVEMENTVFGWLRPLCVCARRARESYREKVLVRVTTMASLMSLVTLIPSYASSGGGEFGDAAVAAQDFSAFLQVGCNNRRSSRSAKELGSSLKWSSSSSFRLPPDLSSVSSVCSGASSQRRLALVCMVLPTGYTFPFCLLTSKPILEFTIKVKRRCSYSVHVQEL